MIWLVCSFAAVAIVGWVSLWARSNWAKGSAYILLLASVAWLSICALGLPRPYWPWGVATGTMLGFYIDEYHHTTYLWVLHAGVPVAVATPFSTRAASRLQQAAKKGPVHIAAPRKGKMLAGHEHGFRVPFMAYPEPWQPGPPKKENQ